MKVSELIELLGCFDTDAEVVITTQPSYPMEHAVAGVAVRAKLRGEPAAGGDAPGAAPGAAPNDVLLVEGRWLRYGDLAAWDAARER